MAILVSGGAGYIGSHTCIELLNAGYDVVVADNYYNASPVVLDRVKQITGKDFRFYNADMTKHEDVEKIFTECPDITAVIQFAAYKAVGESVSKPIEYYYNNLNCTLVILDVMRRHNCKNFVFSSSATVYGDPASVPITEDFPVGATTNPYGTTKAFTERILQDVCKADPSLNVALLRYFNPIGAHKSGLIGEDPNGIPNNLGFLLSNQRTKETKFYTAPGATEKAAQASAMGVVQDLGYIATFPLLLNIAGEPTYFIPLKDNTNLVKSYAMVNVAQYQIVATGSTVSECEQKYVQLLGSKGITTPEERPQTEASGVIAELRSAVLDGNTYYFVRLEGEDVYYSLSALDNPAAVILKVGDSVTIDHAPQTGEEVNPILNGYSLTIDGKATPDPIVSPEPAVSATEATPDASSAFPGAASVVPAA